MKEVALVAALAVCASLASALADPEGLDDLKTLQAQCNNLGQVTAGENVKITVKDTTLTLTCPDKYTAKPAPTGSVPDKEQQIFTGNNCENEVPLKNYCEGATGQTLTNKWKLKLHFPTVPSKLEKFCLKCDSTGSGNSSNKPCTVHVLVESKASPGGPGVSSGDGPQQQGVQTCVQKSGPITVRVPEKESVAQFACGSGLTLYPTEQEKVFSKDCKTQENLKDMTRTQTGTATVRDNAGTAVPTYTLKANKKPAKKTLCYLCATPGTPPDKLETAQDSCTIYVESGSGTQFGLSFIVALALPCVLAMFQFT